MGKSRKNQTKSEKRVEKGGQKQSKQTLKRDENPKKVKPENHLEHIPFRLREIIKSKDKVKRGSFGAKKPKKAEQKATARRSKQDDVLNGDIPVPYFKRRRGESERAYIKRMESETKHVVFLTKNQVDRNPELDADKQELPAGKGKSEKKREHDKMRLNRLQQKKLDRQEAKIEKEMFVDDVPFGEVTLAPPLLRIKPKKAQTKDQKTSKVLMLNSLLGHTVASTAKPSMARQRLMEEERQHVVEAYRQLKKQKQQQRIWEKLKI
uniref:Coiled-coil domain containing 137 n=1 Tax=Iconisemion striatum TaxID=60296 RepID=A0A1A7X407_9TELE